jgi:hypothetical protein
LTSHHWILDTVVTNLARTSDCPALKAIGFKQAFQKMPGVSYVPILYIDRRAFYGMGLVTQQELVSMMKQAGGYVMLNEGFAARSKDAASLAAQLLTIRVQEAKRSRTSTQNPSQSHNREISLVPAATSTATINPISQKISQSISPLQGAAFRSKVRDFIYKRKNTHALDATNAEVIKTPLHTDKSYAQMLSFGVKSLLEVEGNYAENKFLKAQRDLSGNIRVFSQSDGSEIASINNKDNTVLITQPLTADLKAKLKNVQSRMSESMDAKAAQKDAVARKRQMTLGG